MRARCRVCAKLYGRVPRTCERCGARDFEGVDAPGLVSVARARTWAADHIATKTIWDDVLGGGPVLGSTVLVYGAAGVGKTHEALKLADAFARARAGFSVVASAEMNEAMLASYATKLRVDEERMQLHYGTSWIGARRTFGRACCVVIDSIQRYGASSPMKNILKDLEELAAVRVVLSRVNSEGRIAGSTDLRHEPDTVIEVRRKSFRVEKHRWTDRATPYVIERPRDAPRA